MPRPPTTEAEALVWVQQAVAAGRYVPDPHLYRRLAERNLTIQDVKRAIARAASCTAYVPDQGPKAGGTSWRITGPSFAGEDTSVGVEAYHDTGQRRAVLITVF